MYLLCVVVLAVLIQDGRAADASNPTEDTELLLAFMIHRHGDRTPETPASIAAFSSNPGALNNRAQFYGYGQLTNLGKQRAFRMGQFIRRRYNNLLSPKYNASEIFIQSTDVTRTKMSVLAAMAAVYPPVAGDSWSDTVNWEPVPYTTNAVRYDPNVPLGNCPTFINYFGSVMFSPSAAMDPYSNIITQVATSLNMTFPLQDFPVYIYLVYDLLVSQVNLDIPLPKDLQEIWPQIQEAANAGFEVAFGNLEYVDLMSGVLLQEFFDYSNLVLSGGDTPRVRVYSSHDANVYSLESALQLTPKQGVPKYSSLLSLELRRDRQGNVFVLPVYLPTPEEPEIYLQVKGCSSCRCSFDEFTQITSKYATNLETWRSDCQWEDYV